MRQQDDIGRVKERLWHTRLVGEDVERRAPDDAFVERCRKFFVNQVKVQRPRLVLVLGKETPRYLAKTADALCLEAG